MALDIGTSSVRAIAYDAAGGAISGVKAAREQEVRTTPDGGAELDPEELVALSVTCLEEAVAQARAAGVELVAVAVCTVWHSLVGIDDRGQPVTPIILWADTRPAGAAQTLRQRVDPASLHARTGCPVHASYYPAKLLWLAEAAPEAFRRVRWWLSPGEYLFARLLGQPACSLSMASGTGLLHVARLDWDDELLGLLPVRREQFSPIIDVDQACRGLLPAWRQRLGPLADVPWFPALGDGACSNLGSGCASPQRAAVMVGTSGAMRVVGPGVPPTVPPGLWCYRVDRRRFVVGGALSNGGNLVDWLRHTLQLDLSEAGAALAQREPDSHGLTVLPHLAGERSPGWRDDAVGVIHGLRLHTQPLDIFQACLEAVAYGFGQIWERLPLAGLEPAQVVATGGGLLRLPPWMQMVADVLGRPVVASAVAEASSRGAALRAWEALGAFADLATVPAPVGDTYWPDEQRRARYREALARQQRLYARLLGETAAGL